jgi:hypothetical protein
MAVYFIRSGDCIKIGKSDNPWKRMASLQTGSPDSLDMLAVMPGDIGFESGLQEAFSEHLVRGEWYKENDRLMSFIEAVKAAFPDWQESPKVAIQQPESSVQEFEDLHDALGDDVMRENAPFSLEIGQSFTFKMSHKGQFRYPTTNPWGFWERISFDYGGFWELVEYDEWYVMHAPGLRFHMENEQYITVSRVGDVIEGVHNKYRSKRSSVESALNTALKNCIFNRKNSGSWLGVYNDDSLGITIAIRREPLEGEYVRLDVPEEVIAYWRQYQYKTPLPEGISIEA